MNFLFTPYYIWATFRASRWVVAGMSFLATCSLQAQTLETADSSSIKAFLGGTKMGQKVEQVLNKRDTNALKRYDTLYISKPAQRWTVKIRGNVSGASLTSEGATNDTKYQTELDADMKITLGASVTYRGITLSFVLNPAKLTGKNKDYEFNLNAYGNRLGADVVYLSANTFNGETRIGDAIYPITTGDVGMKMFTANGYYIFNHRRFSFPAAFTQSQIQLRSCGTWLLATSIIAGTIKNNSNIVNSNAPTHLSMFHWGIGGGYAYNWVVRRNWLLHVSAMPEIIVLENNRMRVDGERQKTPFQFPNIQNVGRLAVVHFHKRSFLGFSVVINTWNLGDRHTLQLSSVKWRARTFYGIRF